MHWRRKWQPTPVFLPGESQGRGSLVGCRLWGRTESDTTEATWQQQQFSVIMVSVCLPSDALLQHLPSYLGFSYLRHGVSLHGCSSKAQPVLLTLDEGYLLTATLSDLQGGIAPLGPPVPVQPRWGFSSCPPPLTSGLKTWGISSQPPPLTSDAWYLFSAAPP